MTMNRLWVRLSFAFSAVVLIWVIVIILASSVITHSGIRESIVFDDYQSQGGLVDSLERYYAEHGSWANLKSNVALNTEEFAVGQRIGLVLIILDRQGNIIYDTSVVPQEPRWRDVSQLPNQLPLMSNGQTIGYITLEEPKSPLNVRPGLARFVIESLSTALVIMALALGIIGLTFGILVSRTLTAPLNRLAEAARAIGAQNLSRRVKVEGTSEVKDMANAFNEMASALEQTETLRRNLVADVAHELRTPLTVLQGNLLAILDEVYPMDNSEVARLYDQTRLLSRLVDDLHELSQADANKLPLELHPVQLDELVNNTAAKFDSLAEAEGVTLKVEMAANMPLVLADSGRLSQVLHNLLNNALVHTSKGGEITIHTDHSADKVSLQVKDTGDGIPPENLPYIFNRFYRVDSSRNRDTGGTGLGLAIVKALVEAHGGRINVTSDGKIGQGSTFTVELPILKSSKVPAMAKG
ncbi:MAG: HAMP domain-containing protein [Anaerolineaceae bacterium]|nr:HAMP domain-containing protein [Anaerolineaceae bacterium]